jgi:hypothetical protein
VTTPSHVLYSLILLGRKNTSAKNTFAIALGGLLPDVATFLFFPLMLILGKNGQEIWDTIYFESGWQAVWSITHSLWIWPLGLFSAWSFKKIWLQYLFSSMLLHICLDFLVHADDAYAHFWPFTGWRFYSPVSYWDPQHYGNIVSAIESLTFVIGAVFLCKRFKSKWMRGLLVGFSILMLISLIGNLFYIL